MSTYSNHISHYINTQNVWDGYEGDEDIIDLDIPIENDMLGNFTDEENLSDIFSEDTSEDYEYYEDTFEDYDDIFEDYEYYENNWDIYGNLCGENCIGCGYCYDDNNTNNDNEYDDKYNTNEDEHNNDNTITTPLFNCHFLRCDSTICDGWCSKI